MSAKHLSPFGELLRYWRTTRKLSQLDMAIEAEVSARHISFIETGRSAPSREMVLLLAEVLDLPLRDRNALLQAAGYANLYRESDIFAPQMASVRRSFEFLLERHEPYPAMVLNRHWNVLMTNTAMLRLLGSFLDAAALEAPSNVVSLVFDPAGLRPYIVNWDELAGSIVQRLHREVIASPRDKEARVMLERALAANVPPGWRRPDFAGESQVILPMHLRRDDLELRMFSAVTTLGTPQDITLQEIIIETFFPADDATDELLHRLAGALEHRPARRSAAGGERRPDGQGG